MITVDTIIGGLSCLAGCIGTVVAWKTYKNTDSISQTVASAIHQDRIYAELPELFDKTGHCELQVLTLEHYEPLPANVYKDLSYVCYRLKDLLSDNSEKRDQIEYLINLLKPLRTAASDNNINLQYQYLDIIQQIKSLLKSGRL